MSTCQYWTVGNYWQHWTIEKIINKKMAKDILMNLRKVLKKTYVYILSIIIYTYNFSIGLESVRVY